MAFVKNMIHAIWGKKQTDKIGLIVFAIIAPKGRNKIAQGNALMFIHIFSLKCMNEV